MLYLQTGVLAFLLVFLDPGILRFVLHTASGFPNALCTTVRVARHTKLLWSCLIRKRARPAQLGGVSVFHLESRTDTYMLQVVPPNGYSILP